jgi:hypothetical protein
VCRIEGHIVAETIRGRQRIGLVARDRLADAAIWINRSGGAVVGVTQNPAAIFDRAHPRHIQMLPGSAGVAVPAVVTDVD